MECAPTSVYGCPQRMHSAGSACISTGTVSFFCRDSARDLRGALVEVVVHMTPVAAWVQPVDAAGSDVVAASSNGRPTTEMSFGCENRSSTEIEINFFLHPFVVFSFHTCFLRCVPDRLLHGHESETDLDVVDDHSKRERHSVLVATGRHRSAWTVQGRWILTRLRQYVLQHVQDGSQRMSTPLLWYLLEQALMSWMVVNP